MEGAQRIRWRLAVRSLRVIERTVKRMMWRGRRVHIWQSCGRISAGRGEGWQLQGELCAKLKGTVENEKLEGRG
jgi:hypothetical protein